jgi:hypothetical protein
MKHSLAEYFWRKILDARIFFSLQAERPRGDPPTHIPFLSPGTLRQLLHSRVIKWSILLEVYEA